MRKTLIASGAVAALAITLAGCAAADEPADGEWPESITISLVPSVEGEDLAQALDPLTGYLSDNLDIEVNGVVANNYAATVEALGADQAQVIITDAGSLYNATQQYDAELILRDVRFGATSYAAVAYTNDPDTYCEDEPVMANYDASGIELSYCNGLEEAGASAMGQGPMGVEALANASGAEVALQAATSPAGYQYPVVAMRELGIDTDADIDQIPVEGNNNAVLAVANGDAEVGFAYWDARTTVAEEMPDIADKAVAFAYTEMIPNGG
ncbi:MAG: PhnD/SsuA/transferrin family substrate-binding protein, partial [Microbacterium sp.]